MEYIKYVNIGLYVAFAVMLAVRVLWGLKAGLIKSLIRAGGTVLAVVAAFATFALVFKAAEPYVSGELEKYLSSQEGAAVLNELQASKESVIALAEGLLGPLIFMMLFFIWNILFGIVTLILRCVLKLIPVKSGLISRLGGVAVSVATGVLVFVMALMPFAGYAKEVPAIYGEAVNSGAVEKDETVSQVMANLEKDGFAFGKITYGLTESTFTFSSTVTTKSGSKIESFKEVKNVIKLFPKLQALEKMDFSDLSKVDLSPVNSIIDDVGKSDFISTIIAEIAAKAGTEWKAGNEFFGVNLKQEVAKSAPGYENALDGVLDKLASCTKDNCSVVMKEFTKAAKSVFSMVRYFNNVSDSSSGAGTVPTAKELAGVLKDLDESTVDMILPAVSEDVLKGAGLDENQSKLASKVLTDTLTEVAKMTDEAIDNEAEAIDTLLNYATNEKANPDANEVIGALMQSKVVLPSVKTVVDEMPEESEAILGKVSEEQKTAIAEAIDNYKTENPDASQENIDIIKSLFGIA